MKVPTLTVTKDFTQQFNDIIQKFKRDNVLVGIPEEKSSRKESSHETGVVNNATLLAINNFGSPANNIPARPVMEIGIRNAQDQIAEEYKKAAVNALEKGFSAVDQFYGRAGMIAANSVKRAINDQDGISPPSEATMKARESRGFKGTKALIVTGQMRNAITYVVKGKP